MKALLCAALLGLAVAGCAKIEGKTRDLLATSATSYAVLDGMLYEGTVTTNYGDRFGTLQFAAKAAPGQVCAGTMRYTATSSGTAMLQCTGGVEVMLSFTALGASSGFGYGSTVKGPASFTWGMSIQNANAYLRFPEGQAPIPEPPAKPWYQTLF